MRVLIACEFSGIVRDAFIAEGHDAISCDLLPSERPGPHIQGDVRPLLREPWDLVIAHPPCNYLTHYTWLFKNQLRRNIGWWQQYHEAAGFFAECLNANAPLVAVENPPLMHPPARSMFGRADSVCDFANYGSEYRKKIGWWTKGLPPLMATMVNPNGQSLVRDRPHKALRATLKDSPKFYGQTENSHDRAAFQPGMATAMAKQWGTFLYICP